MEDWRDILNAAEIAHMLVEVASDLQADDIVMLDIGKVTTFADYFVILSAESDRQMRAIRDDMVSHLKKSGTPLGHSEGRADGGWLLLDFGEVIVHIFGTQERDFYRLEELWAGAPQVVRVQ